MRVSKLPGQWLAVFSLITLALACNFGQPNEFIPTPEILPEPDVPTPSDSANQTPSSDSLPRLSSDQRHRLASATVLILMLEEQGNEYVPFGWGSGRSFHHKD